jgi:hypothetical protein
VIENEWTLTGRQINRALLKVGEEAGLAGELGPFRHLADALDFPSVELMRVLAAHDKQLIDKGLTRAKKFQKVEHRAERRSVRRRGIVLGWKAFLDGGRSFRFH